MNKEKLIAARALIERGWCQGTYARNKNGYSVEFDSPQATQFCIMGALNRVGLNIEDYRKDLSQGSFIKFNDITGTKDKVLAWFDRRIAEDGSVE